MSSTPSISTCLLSVVVNCPDSLLCLAELQWHMSRCLIWGTRKNDGSFFLLLFLFVSSYFLRSPMSTETLALLGFCAEAKVCLSTVSFRAWTVYSWYETKATWHCFFMTVLPVLLWRQLRVVFYYFFMPFYLLSLSSCLKKGTALVLFSYFLCESPVRLEQNRIWRAFLCFLLR